MTTKVATIRSAPVSATTKNMDINVNVPSKLTSSPLQHAARSGMFVKLHVKDGCGKAVDIPVKNLLCVNTNKESLSNEASCSILRHCALSQLFQFEPNQNIPKYAWRNFLTKFTFESNQHAGTHANVDADADADADTQGKLIQYSITNNTELTDALEVAATIHMIELDEYESEFDLEEYKCKYNIETKTSSKNIIGSTTPTEKKNIIILEIHCEFINRRKNATIAADRVVKTLQEWIQKASAFIVDHASRHAADREYVVVASTSSSSHSSGSKGDTKGSGAEKKKNLDDDQDKDGNQAAGMEWAKRLFQLNHIHRSPPCKAFGTNSINKKDIGPNLLDEYEESLEVMAASFVDGLKKTSKFIQRVIKEQQEKAKKNRRLLDSDDEDCFSLSVSSTPSIVKSVSSISSSSSHIDDAVVEQGIEIIFDPNNQNKSSKSSINGDKDEWKIFFGESKEEKEEFEEEVVMISNPCEEEVISISSSEHNDGVEDLSSSVSSFEQVSESNDDDNDDVSWAMLSDDE